MAKVAITSTDGVTINEHFGRAREFWIYEVNEQGEYQFLERRSGIESEATSSPEELHSVKAELVQDVEVVLTAQIGPRAERELQRQEILALTVTGSIDKALQAYGKRGKFIRNNNLLRSAAGCSAYCGSGSCGGCS